MPIVVSLTGRRVELLARAIINRLEDRGYVEFRDAEAGILVATKTLEGHFAIVASLEREARQRIGELASDREVEDEMRRMAAERNITL
jgi:hypothetical protein